jgi:uncharacterized protein YggE
MAKLDEQIASLQDKLKTLKVRQQNIETRNRAIAAKRERKEDTRRKILVGAIVLAKVEQKLMDESVLRGWLDAALTRADDRALFGLSAETSNEGSG